MKNWKNVSAGYLANHAARLFATALARQIRPMGLAPGQFMLLLELWESDGITQRDLMTRLDIEQATIANTLMRMERDGLVVRRCHPSDSRSQTIHITRRARDLQESAVAAAEEINATALASLSQREQAAFLKAMQSVIAALKE